MCAIVDLLEVDSRRRLPLGGVGKAYDDSHRSCWRRKRHYYLTVIPMVVVEGRFRQPANEAARANFSDSLAISADVLT